MLYTKFKWKSSDLFFKDCSFTAIYSFVRKSFFVLMLYCTAYKILSLNV